MPELIPEQALEVLGVSILRPEMTELFQPLLKRQQRRQRGQSFLCRLDLTFLEERENARTPGALERRMSDVELFLRELARLGLKEAHKEVCAPDFGIVLVLKTRHRHGIEEVLPANDL